MTTRNARLECRQIAPEWSEPLSLFFKTIRDAGDEKHFHPHPLTDDQAVKLCNYTGLDAYYILVEGTEVIGYGLLRGWDEGYDVPSLGIAMHPGVRGSGLGKLFMLLLHAAGRRAGAKKIRLKVYTENHAAIALYKSLGYVFSSAEGDQLVGHFET